MTLLTQFPSVLLKSSCVAIVYVLSRVKKISGTSTDDLNIILMITWGESPRDPVLMENSWLLLLAMAVFLSTHREFTSQYIHSQNRCTQEIKDWKGIYPL